MAEDLTGFSKLRADDDYVYLAASEADRRAFNAMMVHEIEKPAHGLPFTGRWNAEWELVVDEEDADQHRKGLGDCANLWTHLYALISPKAREVLIPLLEAHAELLPARFGGRTILVVNVTRRVARDQLETVGPDDVFRVEPVGFNVYVGENVREAIERAGVTGVRFEAYDPEDPAGII